MSALKALSPEDLTVCCDPDALDFETTAELEPLDEVIGQDRAVEAIRFGIGIRRTGFNVFAFGRHGTGKSTTIRKFLENEAQSQPAPPDWCYVFNFDRQVQAERRPKALKLPAGTASVLRSEMNHLIEDLLVFLPAAFEDDAYQARRSSVAEAFEKQSSQKFEAVSEIAGDRGLAVVQSPEGVGILPLKDEGEVLSPEEFRQLPEEEQQEIREKIESTRKELESAAKSARGVQREARRTLEALDREVASEVVENCMEQVRDACGGLPGVAAWLDEVEGDILENLELFKPDEDSEDEDPTAQAQARRAAEDEGMLEGLSGDAGRVRERRLAERRLRRYAVNVLVEHDPQGGAPVVLASHPTRSNLLGRQEYESQFGTLSTDFTHLRPGAFHQANGGYLVIEASELLKQPFAWDATKRALRNKSISLEEPGTDSGASTTVTLEPEPIPLDCKMILIGEPFLYYLLHMADADFPELFKVPAEFGVTMNRSEETVDLYSRFIATVAAREQMLPFRRCAVARIVDHGARLADDSQKLSTHFLTVTDLLREADYWAKQRKAEMVRLGDVETAIESRIQRLDLARELRHESYARGVVLLDTEGEDIGQVNGLTVLARGEFLFGLPVRITARTRLGTGDVVDIEREADLSGPLHSKGVLILSGFLGGRYVPEDTLAMSASITFEQTYGGVDGDSASSAELYALLSALAELPVKQSLAVTGSVNQAGEVQAIGGVNEKIEGFFDICSERGLTGEQGVLIPESNVQHLMLRKDVIDAVAEGRFSIYPVKHIDEGLELLTGCAAGERSEDGEFPEGSVNRMVEDRLRELADRRRELSPWANDEDE